MTDNKAGCGRCSARWGGSKTAHCAACHETFTTPANFDSHQHYGKCRPPKTRGLIVGARGLWCHPKEEHQDDES